MGEAPLDSPLGRYALNGGYFTSDGRLVIHGPTDGIISVSGSPLGVVPSAVDVLRRAETAMAVMARDLHGHLDPDDCSEATVRLMVAGDVRAEIRATIDRLETVSEHAGELVALPGWRMRLAGRVADARDRAAAAISDRLLAMAYAIDPDEKEWDR